MENFHSQIPSDTSENVSNISQNQKPKLTFLDRYVFLRLPHNRVNRQTFLFNILVLGIFQSFLKNIFLVSFVFFILLFIQCVKRFHDFWKGAIWAVIVFVYKIIVIFTPIIYFMYFREEPQSFVLANVHWRLTLMDFTYMIIYFSVLYVPEVLLLTIPGDKEANKYGEPQLI